MNHIPRPEIQCEQHYAILSFSDVRASADFYIDKLGFELAFVEGEPPQLPELIWVTSRYFAAGEPSPKGCEFYFVVDNAGKLHEFHKANGVVIP